MWANRSGRSPKMSNVSNTPAICSENQWANSQPCVSATDHVFHKPDFHREGLEGKQCKNPINWTNNLKNKNKHIRLIVRDVNVSFFWERTFRVFWSLRKKRNFVSFFVFEFKEKQRFIYCLLIKSLFLFLNVLLSFIV